MKSSVIISDETYYASISKKQAKRNYYDNVSYMENGIQDDSCYLLLFDCEGNEIIDTMESKASNEDFNNASIIISLNDWLNYIYIDNKMNKSIINKIINIDKIILTKEPEAYIENVYNNL